MITFKTAMKLCKRATKRNYKSVHVMDAHGDKVRYLELNRGILKVENVGYGWVASRVPFVGY